MRRSLLKTGKTDVHFYEPWTPFLDTCKIVNGDSSESHTPIYLAHARLYVFADKYGIDHLKLLCLSKLEKTLCLFEIRKERGGDVAKLIRHSYYNDNTPDEGQDLLRTLVLTYVCKKSEFWEELRFVSVLEEGGLFVGDFWTLFIESYEIG